MQNTGDRRQNEDRIQETEDVGRTTPPAWLNRWVSERTHPRINAFTREERASELENEQGVCPEIKRNKKRFLDNAQ